MTVKQVIERCKQGELIILRDRTHTEIKTNNIYPYIKILSKYMNKEIIDSWKDGQNCTIILL